MTLFFADLVRVACHATGPGGLELGAALPGHRGFDAVPAGARFHYAVLGVTHKDEWETGEGEIGSGGILLRLPLASSAAGGAVDFSPGLKTVALTVAAAWFAGQEEAIAIADVGGLQAMLDGKAALADVEAVETALAGKAPAADLAALASTVGGKAALAGAAFGGAVSAPSLTLGTDLAVADGGTGASSAAAARSNLGLGSMATQDAGAVAITGGSIAGLASDLAVADGGTGASNAAAARSNLGLGSMATQDAGAVAVTGGTVSGLTSLGVAGNADITGTYRVSGVQVAGARRTGWTAAGGTASRASFETGLVTAPQLAQRVKALIDDLIAHGLIGS